MNIYVINIIAVLTLAVIQALFTRRRAKEGGEELELHRSASRWSHRIVMIILFAFLFIEMAFRGDFVTDYQNYYIAFSNSAETFSELIEKSQKSEIGFLLLNMLVHKISENYVVLLAAVACIAMTAYCWFMYKESPVMWLSVLILLCSGSFYAGFNAMSQFLAAALFSLCYKYVYKQQFLLYCLCVLLVASFHQSALFMLPLYFVLNFKWERVTKGVALLAAFLLVALVYFMTDDMVALVTRFTYQEYASDSAYGMGIGRSVLGTVKAVVMSGGVLVFSRYFDLSNAKERMVYNGCILYLLISVCSMKIYMIHRIAYFFVPCIMLAYPLILSKMENKKTRRLFTVLFTVMFIGLQLNILVDPEDYYFYWNNRTVKWW